jgi:hypothetical protein
MAILSSFRVHRFRSDPRQVRRAPPVGGPASVQVDVDTQLRPFRHVPAARRR